MKNPNLNFSSKQVPPNETAPAAILCATDAVNVMGPRTLVQGNDIVVSLTRDGPPVDLLRAGLPAWWEIEHEVPLWLRSPSQLRFKVGPTVFADASIVREATQRVYKIASNLPLSTIDDLDKAVVTVGGFYVPGSMLDSGNKLPSVALAAGYNALGNPSVPGYFVVRLYPPVGTTAAVANSQAITPLFAYLAIGDRSVRFGDLAGFAGPGPFVLILATEETVTEFGFWCPDVEIGTDAAADKFWRADWQFYATTRIGAAPGSGQTGLNHAGGGSANLVGSSPLAAASAALSASSGGSAVY